MFNSYLDVFLTLLNYLLSDMRLIDFLVIESVFLLKDISKRFAWIVEIRQLVTEAELVVNLIRRLRKSHSGQHEKHDSLIPLIFVRLKPLTLPSPVYRKGFYVKTNVRQD